MVSLYFSFIYHLNMKIIFDIAIDTAWFYTMKVWLVYK